MTIKEAEKTTGVSSRNIRFYEQKGLLKPERNAENDYREYFDEEIRRLKLIRALRMVDMPLEQIREVLDGKLFLSEAAAVQRNQLIARAKQLEAAIALCTELCESQDVDVVLQRIDAEETYKHLFRNWLRDYLENTKQNVWLLLIGLIPSVAGLLIGMTTLQIVFVIPIVAEIVIAMLLFGWGAVGYYTTEAWGNLRKNVLLSHMLIFVGVVLLEADSFLAENVLENMDGFMEAAKYVSDYPFYWLVPFRMVADDVRVINWMGFTLQHNGFAHLVLLVLAFTAGGVVSKLRAFREAKRKSE